MTPKSLLLALAVVLCPGQADADKIRVATASNFQATLSELAALFEAGSAHEVIIIPGSSGKHFAQILQGAPFDALFSADRERPVRLEREGLAIAGSRFTYALGQLVLWYPAAGNEDAAENSLKQGKYRYLAIANPKLAPYGEAAREVLQALGLWDRAGKRLVRGENIAQTYQFVFSGNAELGFVALAQLGPGNRPASGSRWRVPADLYRPIEQQAVILQDKSAVRDFMVFVRGEEAARIIQNHGYDVP
jgi:molybdate transport system substrate-binding protein